MTRLVLASKNAGKIRELQQILSPHGIEIAGLDEYPDIPTANEHGRTFFENAFIKALHYGNLTHSAVLADDSGLEVDALGGAPGVDSAIYAGPQADDAANNALLIQRLSHSPTPPPWPARYRCVLVAFATGGRWVRAEGTCEGEIRPNASGSGGFGYDPYFYLPDRGKSMADLPHEEKNQISHRGRALAAILNDLKGLLHA